MPVAFTWTQDLPLSDVVYEGRIVIVMVMVMVVLLDHVHTFAVTALNYKATSTFTANFCGKGTSIYF